VSETQPETDAAPFEPDVGVYAASAGDTSSSAWMETTRGRASQAEHAGQLDEPVTDLSTTGRAW